MTDPTNEPSTTQDEQAEFEALSAVVRALQSLGPEARKRVLGAVATFLGVGPVRERLGTTVAPSGGASFTEDRTPSAKEFLLSKRPKTEVERVACLAYYLTHYRDTPQFKTLDISKLNAEAAQLKFSNASYTVEDAARAGLLVPTSRGAKQLSAHGELYVQTLPDRAAAKAGLQEARPRRRTKRDSRDSGRSVEPDHSSS